MRRSKSRCCGRRWSTWHLPAGNASIPAKSAPASPLPSACREVPLSNRRLWLVTRCAAARLVRRLGLGAFKFHPGCGPQYNDPRLVNMNARFAGASIVFCVPLIRELILLMGVRDASRRTLRHLLSTGHSVGVQPGGIHEMLHSDSSQEALYFQRGLGFVRLAMEFGRPLLPCYSFGENQLVRHSPRSLCQRPSPTHVRRTMPRCILVRCHPTLQPHPTLRRGRCSPTVGARREPPHRHRVSPPRHRDCASMR